MGAVTSTLERMVIGVAWAFHEWFYGSASGDVTCNDSRRVPRRRFRRVQHALSTKPCRIRRRCVAPQPQPIMPLDAEEEKRAALFSQDVRVTSTPEPVLQRVHVCAEVPEAPSGSSPYTWDAADLPLGASLPTELQAALFRCTAARNGRLHCDGGLSLAKAPQGLRQLYGKRVRRRSNLPPVLPPLLPTYQRIARLRV